MLLAKALSVFSGGFLINSLTLPNWCRYLVYHCVHIWGSVNDHFTSVTGTRAKENSCKYSVLQSFQHSAERPLIPSGPKNPKYLLHSADNPATASHCQ